MVRFPLNAVSLTSRMVRFMPVIVAKGARVLPIISTVPSSMRIFPMEIAGGFFAVDATGTGGLGGRIASGAGSAAGGGSAALRDGVQCPSAS